MLMLNLKNEECVEALFCETKSGKNIKFLRSLTLKWVSETVT